MSRVVSVDKSLITGGTIQWFVTVENETGDRTRVQVGEAEALRFQQVIQAQDSRSGPRVLTETIP